MESIETDQETNLAARLKAERAARGWSLAELAARAGVSKPAISKIERGEVSPTATVLVRLAGAFGLTLAELLVRAAAPLSRLSRAAVQPRWQDPETGYRRTQVFCRPDHPVELVTVDMPPGQGVTFPPESYGLIRQTIWVLAGRLEISEGPEHHLLAAGDCLGFGPPAPVRLANPGPETCHYLVALARAGVP